MRVETSPSAAPVTLNSKREDSDITKRLRKTNWFGRLLKKVRRSRPFARTVVERVHFSVTARQTVLPGTTFTVNVWAHLKAQREQVVRQAQETLQGLRMSIQTKGPAQIARNTTLSIRLQIHDLIIEDSEDSILWDGEIGNATFSVIVPKTVEQGAHGGLASVFVDGLQIAKIHFVVDVTANSSRCDRSDRLIPAREELYRSAFASYAREDRNEVLSRVHGMLKVAPELDLFLDVVSLRSGEGWEKRLWDEISARDVFYLFWSANARKSPWVEKEWRCALQARGLDFIDPVPLVSPELVPPPPELASKHFNDWVLAFVRNKRE